MSEMVYLASYKSVHKGWTSLINRGIRWLTKSRHSHTEVCIGNPFESAVPCVSSSGVEGGVREKVMQLSPDKWDIQPMPWVRSETVRAFLAEHEGEKYDYLGSGRFLLPFLLREHPSRWFCTEVAAEIAGYNEPWRFNPADFHIIVDARNK